MWSGAPSTRSKMAIVKTRIFQQTQNYLPYLICLLVFILGGCGSASTPSSGAYAEINSPLPIISQGRVYVNTGLLQFFDQKTGAKVGSYQIGKPNLSFQFDPIIANGSIYIIGDPTIAAPKGFTGYQEAVYALQEKSGAILWQSLVDATAVVGIAGDLVYIYAHDSTLMALQISDGKVRWKYSTGNATTDFTSFDVLQGVVYVGSSDASLSALDATTGAVLWHHTL